MDHPGMSTRLRAIESDAMKLSAEERAELVEHLVASLDRTGLGSEWRDEVLRRIAEYDAGRTKSVPLDEALSRLEERARRAGP
jgi:putative addiction module component (TIGR02574 family)